MRAAVNDQEQQGFGGNGRDDGVTPLVLDHRGPQRSAAGCLADGFSGGGNGGSQRGQVLAVEVAVRSSVDQEGIAPQNHHGLDTFAVSEGPHEVVYGGQGQLRRLFVRSLIGDRMKSSEQSLEVSQVRRLL